MNVHPNSFNITECLKMFLIWRNVQGQCRTLTHTTPIASSLGRGEPLVSTQLLLLERASGHQAVLNPSFLMPLPAHVSYHCNCHLIALLSCKLHMTENPKSLLNPQCPRHRENDKAFLNIHKNQSK